MNSSILGGRRNNCFFCSGLNFNNPIGYLLMIEVMWKRPCQQVLQLKNVLHRVINILGHPDNTCNGEKVLTGKVQNVKKLNEGSENRLNANKSPPGIRDFSE